MEKFIAVVFDTEEAAYAGAEAMQDLHRNGELAVYSAAVIGKNADGVVEIKKSADEGPLGTALGLAVGAMIGVLAGPAAVASGAAVAGSAAAAQAAAGGMALGSMTGGMFGAYRDLWVAGIDSGMLENVAIELLPGKSCIVASVDEIWTTPLDVKMSAAGGTVYRKPRVDAMDEQWEAEMQMLDRELTALAAEIDAVDEENRAAVQAKIDAAKARMKEKSDAVKARLDEMDAELDARLAALDEQIANSTAEMKEKFAKRKAEVSEEYRVRKEKLKASAKLAGEALAL